MEAKSFERAQAIFGQDNLIIPGQAPLHLGTDFFVVIYD
jgi:hypothetical protein